MFRIDKNTDITPEILIKLVEGHSVSRLDALEQYYKGNHKILERKMVDAAKPNNKIVNPYANYITDMMVGYFMGEAISYSGADDRAVEELQLTFTYNDEQDENSELAKDASVYGVAHEMLYVDENGATRFKRVNPKEVIIIYDNTVENEMLYAIRHYIDKDILTNEDYIMIEVYGRKDIKIYKATDKLTNITLVDEREHYFNLVPFVVYKNNDDEIGDFELVVSLIDAYDKLSSDSLNDFEYFCDAYMALSGMTADQEDIKLMKENRVLLLDEGAKAEWVIKNTNDANMENIKNRLAEDIHKFSKCPAMTDKDFAGNASGVAMKYKLMGMENITAVKERKFKKGLQRRIELIANIMQLKSTSLDWRAININFTRNIPTNAAEIADLVNKLRGMVSNETLVSQLPFVEDVAAELEKLKEENASLGDVFSFVGGSNELLEQEITTDSTQSREEK